MSQASPIREPDYLMWAFHLALALTAWRLMSLAALPLQDFPNHLYVLEVDRALRQGASSPFFAPSTQYVFGYSLYLHLTRAFGLVCSTELALRLVTVAGALALPWSAALAARRLGAGFYTGGLLAMPLALSWSFKIGLIPFVLAMPFLVALIGASVEWTRRRSIEAALYLLLLYLAHPLALIAGWTALGVFWLVLHRNRSRSLTVLFLINAPVIALLAWDLSWGGLNAIDEVAASWEPLSTTTFRPLTHALAHLATRAYGIVDARMLLLYAPLIATVLYLIYSAVRRNAKSRRPLIAVAATALILALESVVAPAHYRSAFLLGARLALPCALTATLLAVAACDAPRRRLAAVAFSSLALIASLFDLTARSHEVASLIAHPPKAAPPGAYLTARLNPAKGTAPEWLGDYDPLRHAWTYVASPRAATPFAFAFARYLPIWYRAGAPDRFGPAPKEWQFNMERPEANADVAAVDNRDRVLGALRAGARDGVVVYGAPREVDRVMDELRVFDRRFNRLGSGFLLIQKNPAEVSEGALAAQ